MSDVFDLSQYGIQVQQIHRNAVPAELYEHAVKFDGGEITAAGAVAVLSAAPPDTVLARAGSD